MNTCPGCFDLVPTTAIHCGGCGKALLPFPAMVVALAARRHLAPPANARPWRSCDYCGGRCRGRTCGYHSDLPALEQA